jgi:outer membrane lipoprotein-sorting protein
MNAQQKDPNKLLNRIVEKFNRVNDYEVDLSVKLDFEMIKVPDSKAKIFFKQPDKIKIDSKGFAMIPKQSTNFSPTQFLKGDFTSLYVRSEIIGNRKLDVIKIIPDSDSTDVILSTLWIDDKEQVIRKVETTGKRSGTIHIFIDYDGNIFGLPSQIKFEFNLGNIQVPEDPRQQKEKSEDENKPRSRRQLSGSVIISYSNYIVNQGIDDSLFEDKKENN